jgi:alkylation response protein AidB-like acyl-CoA dehydrogenase
MKHRTSELPSLDEQETSMSTFALSDEHEALRRAVRELAGDRIAPRAAEIDRTGEFPWDVHEALVKADFHAMHVPEAYGGAPERKLGIRGSPTRELYFDDTEIPGGRLIGAEFQGLRFMLADMAMELEAARQLDGRGAVAGGYGYVNDYPVGAYPLYGLETASGVRATASAASGNRVPSV